MTNTEPPEGYEPVPGESRLGLVSTAVVLGIAVAVLVGVLIGSPANFGWPLVIVLLTGLGFTYSLVQRRTYLRDRRNGKPLIRRPWRGENLAPPG